MKNPQITLTLNKTEQRRGLHVEVHNATDCGELVNMMLFGTADIIRSTLDVDNIPREDKSGIAKEISESLCAIILDTLEDTNNKTFS